ncbi:MAG TPA: hypothetical protein VIF62_27015 [Labilithrix sp.]
MRARRVHFESLARARSRATDHMNAPKRRIVLSKRPATLTFTEDEQPTAPYRSRPPEIRRSSGTRVAVRGISERPTVRPPAVAPAVSMPTPFEPIAGLAPAPPIEETHALSSSGEVVVGRILEEAPELEIVSIEPIEEEAATIPRAPRRRTRGQRRWGGAVVLAMLLVAAELAIAHWPRVAALLVGE